MVRVSSVMWDQLVLRVLQDLKDSQERMDSRVLEDQMVLRGHQVSQALQDYQGPLDLVVVTGPRAIQGHLGPLVSRERVGPQGRRDSPELMGVPDPPVRLVVPVLRGRRVSLAPRVLLVSRVVLDLMAPLELQVHQVTEEPLVSQEHQESLGQQGPQALRDRLALLAYQASTVLLA